MCDSGVWLEADNWLIAVTYQNPQNPVFELWLEHHIADFGTVILPQLVLLRYVIISTIKICNYTQAAVVILWFEF